MQRTPSGSTERTISSSWSLFLRSSSVSSSYALSKWSSMARLLRPVTKIISVMPAAAASSTAYWMSGLSTTGSISFGLALVTGRKRLPRPATGNTALRSFACTLLPFQKVDEFFFTEHFHAELARLVQLAARLVARDHIVGPAGHRAADLVAHGLDRGARLVAAHAGKRARQDECLAIPGAPCSRFEKSYFPRKAIDGLAVVRLLHEFLDALHDLRADAFQRHLEGLLAPLLPLGILLPDGLLVCRQLRPIGIEKRRQGAEMARDDLGHLLSHARNAEGEDEPGQLPVAGARDARHQVGGRLAAHALEAGQQVLRQAIEVRGAL